MTTDTPIYDQLRKERLIATLRRVNDDMGIRGFQTAMARLTVSAQQAGTVMRRLGDQIDDNPIYREARRHAQDPDAVRP